jgi:hypothetical protein
VSAGAVERCVVAGRVVVLRRGSRSQTVSICTSANQVHVYERRYRFPVTTRVSCETLADLPDLDALHAWLAERGDPEAPGDGPGSRQLPLVDLPPVDDPWLPSACRAVEAALRELVDDFRARPYLHRVEQSIHAQLFGLLMADPLLQEVVPLRTGERTQLVHKEWPETRPRVVGDDRPPRGRFDFAVLAPSQVRQASLEQFRDGRIAAPIVVEVGLDYPLKHLTDDEAKLRNSEVPHGYLLHLSRIPMRDRAETERFLCATEVSAAYVHVDRAQGVVRHMHVDGTDVTTGPWQG